MMKSKKKSPLASHSLSIAVLAVVCVLILLYIHADPGTHRGAFYGNAIADWTGMFVTVVATKYLHEIGSAESHRVSKPPQFMPRSVHEFLHEHSLVIFLVVTGAVWAVAFARMHSDGKWGQVVGNIVSEWTQILGIVVLTKHLIEKGSKESN